MNILTTNPGISVKEIAKILNVTSGKVRYYTEIMKKAGIIEHTGSTKKGKWIVHKENDNASRR